MGVLPSARFWGGAAVLDANALGGRGDGFASDAKAGTDAAVEEVFAGRVGKPDRDAVGGAEGRGGVAKNSSRVIHLPSQWISCPMPISWSSSMRLISDTA